MFLYFSIDEELQMKAALILSEVAQKYEWPGVLLDCPFLIRFILSAYKNARTQPNHRSSIFENPYSGSRFLKLLLRMSAADKSVAGKLVNEGGLAEISAVYQMDPNGRDADGGYLYFEVLYATEILANILQAENGKPLKRVRRERDLRAGVVLNILYYRFKICALYFEFQFHSLMTTKCQI